MSAAKTDLVEVLLKLYDIQTKLYINALADIKDIDAQNRMGTKANHIAWIAGSLLQQRFELANALGIEGKQGADELFRDFQGIQDDGNYPSLDQYRADWQHISPKLRTAMTEVSEEKWNGPEPFRMMGDANMFDAFTECTHREAYMIGQLGIYRRLLNYPAMKYE